MFGSCSVPYLLPSKLFANFHRLVLNILIQNTEMTKLQLCKMVSIGIISTCDNGIKMKKLKGNHPT